MKTDQTIHIEDQLKFLMRNLEQGAGLFFTDEGRKAYFKALLIEIPLTTKNLEKCIALIKQNQILFPNQALFKTDFLKHRENIKLAWELLQDDMADTKNTIKLTKAINDLCDQLLVAHTCLYSPDTKKMLEYYQVLWNTFEQKKWPVMKQDFQSHVMAGLPASPHNRIPKLRKHLNNKLDELTHHPIAVKKLIDLEGNLLDEISCNGHLVAEAIAPVIFNYRNTFRNNKCIYEFFNLFMTYQMLKDELEAIKSQHGKDPDSDVKKWFEQLSNKVTEAVRPEYEKTFPNIIHLLCGNNDILSTLKVSTLQGPYNLKLAYNLFGVMFDKGLFKFKKVAPLRKLLSDTRQDEYFKTYLYSDFGSYTSQLTPQRLAEVQSIVDSCIK